MNILEAALVGVRLRQSYKGRTIHTVGELRRALEKFPDDTPLAIAGHGVGWGIKEPFASERYYRTEDSVVYCAKEDPNESGTRKLPALACVLEPSVPALDR